MTESYFVPIHSSFNVMAASSGEETVYPSEALEFTHQLLVGFMLLNLYLVLCVVFFFYHYLSFNFWSLYCLSFLVTRAGTAYPFGAPEFTLDF